MPALSKQVTMGLGAGIALVAGLGFFLFLRPTSAPSDDPNAQGDGAQKPPVRQSLKLQGAVSQPPDWLVAEAPFDLKEVFLHVPDDENAAPLYLEALIEFSLDVINLFPENQHEALRQRYGKRSQSLARLFEAWDKDRTSVSATELDALLTEFEAGFAKLVEAQKRPRCVFESGITVSSLLPHANPSRAIGNVVRLQTARDLEHGVVDRPLRLLDILLRLSRDLRIRGLTILQFVSTAMDLTAYKAMTEILDSRHCTPAHSNQLVELLVRHEKEMPDAAGTAMKLEYLVIRSAMRDIEYRSGEFTPQAVAKTTQNFGGKPGSIGTFLATFGTSGETRVQRAQQIDARLELMTAADYSREGEMVNNYFRALIEMARQPLPQARLTLERLNQTAGKSLFLSAFTALDFASGEALFTAARAAAHLRGMQSLVAMRRWQLQGKGVPPDLESVVKAVGLKGVPTDPYSGAPLKMTLIAGQPVVYSVGPDGKDDQGHLESKGRNQPGDYIFRLATPFSTR